MSIESNNTTAKFSVEKNDYPNIYSHTKNLIEEAWDECYKNNFQTGLTDNKKRTEEIMTNLESLQIFLGEGNSCSSKIPKKKQITYIAQSWLEFGGSFDKKLNNFIEQSLDSNNFHSNLSEIYLDIAHTLIEQKNRKQAPHPKNTISKQLKLIKQLLSSPYLAFQ
jgi:hypothetical protein